MYMTSVCEVLINFSKIEKSEENLDIFEDIVEKMFK